MREINEYLARGTYRHGADVVVVLDVVTHSWNSVLNLPEALPEPMVVVRKLVESFVVHERTMFPLSYFKQHYERY